MFYTKKPQVPDIQLLADFKCGERGTETFMPYHTVTLCFY